MAEIMSNSDLCIGAAGSTSWERCCLGQPTITFSIADNQVEIAEQLSKKNIAIYSNLSNLLEDFDQFFGSSGKELQRVLITNSLLICDGFGAPRVIEESWRRNLKIEILNNGSSGKSMFKELTVKFRVRPLCFDRQLLFLMMAGLSPLQVRNVLQEKDGRILPT